MTGESDVTEYTVFVIILAHFRLRYSRALRGITTGWDDIDCLEKRGVDAGPNGEDDIQLSFGFRDTEGCWEVGRAVLGEYTCGTWVGRGAVWHGKDVARLCPDGAWVGGGAAGSSLTCRRNRLSVGIALLAGPVVGVRCANEEKEDELAERDPV